jgi:hypothetical protein
MHRRFFCITALPVLSLVLAGCGERQFRAETTWHPDGRLTRTIYQHEDETPDRAAWESVREVDRVDIGWQFPLEQAPKRPQQDIRDGQRAYVVARATFDSPDRLPGHVRIAGLDETKIGRLERTTATHDLGLVTEYHWRETLADVVTLADMVAARREAANLEIDLVETALAGAEEYDTSALIEWLRRDGTLWFEQSHAAMVEVALRRPENGEEAISARLIEIAARYGLVLRDEAGAPLPPEEGHAVVRRYVLAKVRETVRTAGGEPIDEAAARRLLQRLGFTGEDLLSWEASKEWKRAIESRFAAQEAYEARWSELTTRLLGVYGFGPSRPFRYEMTVPGVIVETTGERLSTNRVRWRFLASDAFPLGYLMSCRSLVPNEAAQRALLGDRRLDEAGAMADYVSLIRADHELQAAVKRCIEAGSLVPLDDYARDLGPEARARAEALRKLLNR